MISAAALLDIVFPRNCCGCSRVGAWLCPTCSVTIQQPLQQWFTGLSLASLLTLGPYAAPAMQQSIRTMKFHRIPDLATMFGNMLSSAFHAQGTEHRNGIVIPIPLHRRRRRLRGFDQTAIIAQAFADRLGMPCYSRVLVRHRATRPQASLAPTQRQHNVSGSFQHTALSLSQALPKDATIFLVDDVVTSGATMLSAAAVLASDHPHAIHGIAVARASE